jgi:hypothetical protein
LPCIWVNLSHLLPQSPTNKTGLLFQPQSSSWLVLINHTLHAAATTSINYNILSIKSHSGFLPHWSQILHTVFSRFLIPFQYKPSSWWCLHWTVDRRRQWNME